MRRAGEGGADQALGVWPDLAGPAAEPIRRPFGVTPVRAGHVVGVRAVLAAHAAALVIGDALAAMEDPDRARGDANLDLGANQRARNRIEEVMDLDVIIERRARARAGLTRARRHSANSQSSAWQAVEGSPFQIVLDRRPRHPQTPPDLARSPRRGQPQQMSQLSHAQFPLRGHPRLLVDHRRARTASIADSREQTPSV